MQNKPEKRVFGRRLGRPLSPLRQNILETLLPTLEIPMEAMAQKAALAPATLFQTKPAQIWMEIGFGSGEHLSALMRRHPDRAYIGAEPFVNGMSNFLLDIEQEPHGNIRVFMDDAMLVVEALADESLDGFYILNPDPWHKKRHHKRRIVRKETLDQFARVLKPGAAFIMSTDVPYLAEWIVTEAVNHPAFEWQAQSAADWKTRPKDWIITKYEEKGAKGASEMVYLLFKKRQS